MNNYELQALFYQEIPITKAMGITVTVVAPDTIEIGFNLAENKNHKGTAFGGSQYTACALACYGLFLVGLREKGFSTNNIVISEGRIKYKLPVKNDFVVRASWKDDKKTSFFKMLSLKKKSKVEMTAQIFSENQICAEFSGDFVAILDSKLNE